MSVEQNKMVAHQVFAALDGRDLEGVVANYAPDCRFYGWRPEPLDIAGYKATIAELFNAFPNSHFLIDRMIAEGDLVAVQHNLRGTHKDTFRGIPATGKPVVVNSVVILHLVNGKATELWLNADFLGMLQQLGVVPA